MGGRYAIFASTDPAAVPSVAGAAVSFSTVTEALARQDYLLTGLLGNATYFVSVFLADASGNYSGASNLASAETLAGPPRNVQTLGLGATAFALAWDTGANAPGTQYQIELSSGPGLVLAVTPFTADLSSIAYAGLDANKTYFVAALERNNSLALTPAVIIATEAANIGLGGPAMIEGGVQTAVVMLLVASSALLGNHLTEIQAPQQLARAITELTTNKWFVLALLNVLFLLLGMFLHSAAAIILVVPVVMPLVKAVGIDPVHFGLIVTINLGIGQQTPPVASVLMVACSIAKATVWEVSRVNIWFIGVLFAVLMLITYVPVTGLGLVQLFYR